MENFHVRPLSESDIHAVISAAGGDFAYPDSDRRRTLNADFLLAGSIIELKALDDEGLTKPERQVKLANLFRKEEPSRPVIVLDRAKLPTQGQREYDRILEGPIKAAVSHARKQLKQSRSDHPSANCTILWVVNNGYTALDHDSLVRMVAHRARNDTREIDGVVVAGCYFYSDSFDSYFVWPIEYIPVNVDHPFASFDQLKNAWNNFANEFMTSVVRGEFSKDLLKGPVVDTQFSSNGVTYVKPAPPMGLPSGFFTNGRPRNDSTGITRCPPVATVFPELTTLELANFRDVPGSQESPFSDLRSWQDERSSAIASGTATRPFVPIPVTFDGWNEWCEKEGEVKHSSTVFGYATALFDKTIREIIAAAREHSPNSIIPTRYILVVTEEIGQDRANDVSHILMVREYSNSNPVVKDLATTLRLFHEYAIALASAYAVREGLEFVLWQKDLTYAWV